MKRSNILCILIEQISVVDVSATVLMVLNVLVGLLYCFNGGVLILMLYALVWLFMGAV